MINNLRSYGYYTQLIEIQGRNVYTNFNKELTTDKKTKASFYIRCRYKNSKRSSDENNEVMSLEFDTNLSQDFVYSFVDFKTGKSLEIKMTHADQPFYGKTNLKYEVQHINEEQELFVNRGYSQCETEKGTITKRLQIYKNEFDRFCNEEFLKFQTNGFKVNLQHVIENIGCHIYFNYLKSKSYAWNGERVVLNEILLMFSSLNNDCFKNRDDIDIYSSPFYVRDSNFNVFCTVSIDQEYVELIKKLVPFYNSHANFFRELTNHKDLGKYSNKQSYDNWKEGFLKEWYKSNT